jgi:hypothetical protein
MKMSHRPVERVGKVDDDHSAAHNDPGLSRAAHEQLRDDLLARLHARSDDFDATKELEALRKRWALVANAETGHVDDRAPDARSFRDRVRARRRNRVRDRLIERGAKPLAVAQVDAVAR